MEQIDTLPPFPTDSVPVQSVSPTRKDFMRKYKTSVIKWLAITQTTVGLLIIILGIIGLSIRQVWYNPFCRIGYEIWFGILVSIGLR